MKSTYKKTLVRNTEQTLPKTIVKEPQKEEKCKNSTDKISKKYIKPTVTFDNPEPNSSLELARRIKTLESLKPRRIKSVPNVNKNQLAINEKVAKQVNFAYEKPIYKDLIPLCVKMQTQATIPSREPLPHKDKEPILSDFYTPRQLPEYSFQVPKHTYNKPAIRCYNGLKLYKTMQNW